MKLQSNVVEFLRRYSKGPHSLECVATREILKGDATDTRVYRSQSALQDLRAEIASFRRSFPPELSHASQATGIDGELIAAVWLAHG